MYDADDRMSNGELAFNNPCCDCCCVYGIKGVGSNCVDIRVGISGVPGGAAGRPEPTMLHASPAILPSFEVPWLGRCWCVNRLALLHDSDTVHAGGSAADMVLPPMYRGPPPSDFMVAVFAGLRL